MDEFIYDANQDTSHFNRFDMKNRKGKLVVLEGLDGAGKSSQIKLIKNYLKDRKLSFVNLHFPMYGKNLFADVITQFLKGEYGNVDEVDPLFLANIYGMDRYKSKVDLARYLTTYDYVILDRYVHSNMAFQGAKYDTDEKRQGIVKWINDFEFRFLQLPYPDLIIYFDLPIDVIKERLESNRIGDDRNYLDGKQDVHEADLDFQSRVRNIYLGLQDFDNFKVIKCVDKKGVVYTPEQLFETYNKLI